jgi:hypothetical protein
MYIAARSRTCQSVRTFAAWNTWMFYCVVILTKFPSENRKGEVWRPRPNTNKNWSAIELPINRLLDLFENPLV